MLIVNVSSYSSFSTVYPHSEQVYSLALIFGLPVFSFLGLPIMPFLHLGHSSLKTQAFILPSSREGASVSVMEALARNVPIVTTDIAGMPLMIKDEKEGYVVPQRNSSEIAKAVKKILKWENRNIKKSAEQYKWKRIVDETVKDYEEI